VHRADSRERKHILDRLREKIVFAQLLQSSQTEILDIFLFSKSFNILKIACASCSGFFESIKISLISKQILIKISSKKAVTFERA